MPKKLVLPTGESIDFPDDVTPEFMHQEGVKFLQSRKDSWDPAKVDMQVGAQGTYDRKQIDQGIDVARPFVAQTAGNMVGATAAKIPYVGPAAGLVARHGTYALTDALMQYLKENKPESFGSAYSEGLKQDVINTGLNTLLGGVFKGMKAVRNADQPEIYNFKPTTSQAAAAQGVKLLPTVAKTFEDLTINAKQKALDRTAGAGFTEALRTARNVGFDRTDTGQYMFSMNPQKSLSNVQKYMPLGEGSLTPISVEAEAGATLPGKSASKSFQQNLKSSGTTYTTNVSGEPQLNELATSFKKVDDVIRDPKKLQDTLTTAQVNGVGENLKRSLQGYQFQKMFNEAADRELTRGISGQSNVVRIDPKKLNDMWLDPEMQDSFKVLYNSKQRADIQQFFKNIAFTQDKMTQYPVAKRLWMMHGGIGIATGLMTGGSIPAGAGASAATFIGAEGLGRLLTNPKTARIMVALAGGEPLGVSEQYAAKVISNALQGQAVAAISDKDGSMQPYTMGK